MRGRGCFAPCVKKSTDAELLKFDIVQIHCKLKPYAPLRREKGALARVVFSKYKNGLYGCPAGER